MGNQSSKHHRFLTSSKGKKFVHWKNAERPAAPGRPIFLPICIQKPDIITLQWDKPQTDGGSSVIGYIIEQRKVGTTLWARAIDSLVAQNEVSINGLEIGAKYQFRIIAENIVGKSEPSETSEVFYVIPQRNSVNAPRFIVELKDKTAIENSRVEMKVTVTGSPPPAINWFKDGFEIFSSRRTKITNDNGISVLVIHQVAFTDEGEIKCSATNRVGHVATRARLIIEAPAKIRMPRQYEEGLIVEAEETLRLKVGIAGKPNPAVVWYHENEQITNNERFEVINTEKNSLLKILNIKRTDRGEYFIRSFNKLGEDTASFLVTVTSKPTPPSNIFISMSFGRSATLTWTAPEDDGGCKIGNYIIEYYRIGWDVWLKASTSRQLTATLHDLIEGSEYKFRVKAESPYGISEPSEESKILTISEQKKPERNSENEIIIDTLKPMLQRRRSVSPYRNFAPSEKKGMDKKEKPSVASTSTNAFLMPETYANEDLTRAMSYGISSDFLAKTDNPLESDSTISQERQVKTYFSPLFKRSQKWKPSNDNNADITDVTRSPCMKRRNSLSPLEIGHKMQNFFSRSPSPLRRNKKKHKVLVQDKEEFFGSSQNSDKSYPEVPNDEYSCIPVKFCDTLETQQQDFSEVRGEKSHLGEDYLKFSLSYGNENHKQNVNEIEIFGLHDQLQQIIGTNISRNISQDDSLKQTQQIITNPKIRVSPPGRPFEKTKQEKEIQDGQEFMLLFYSKKESKENKRSKSFDNGLNESVVAPRLSLSVPDLSEAQKQQQILRRSVSSTELLYERAMARFYEAVEMEQAELAKENTIKVTNQNNSSDEHSLEAICNKKFKMLHSTTRKGNDFLDNDQINSNENVGFEDDYTESTASSEDSLEKFKTDLNTKIGLEIDELNTYHPQQTGVFSPYRSPTNDQSSVILSKPMPLASPEFIPKPILKKSLPEEYIQPKVNKNIKSKSNCLGKGIKSFFKKDKSPEIFIKSEKEDLILNKSEPSLKSNDEITKLTELTSSNDADTSGIVEHYNDMIREVKQFRKKSKPIYLSSEHLKSYEGLASEENEKFFENGTSILSKQKITPEIDMQQITKTNSNKNFSINGRTNLFQNKIESTNILDNETKTISTLISKPNKKLILCDKNVDVTNFSGNFSCSMNESRVSIVNEIGNTASIITKTNFKNDESDLAYNRVKSTISYLTDIGLFIVACWIYIFKDVRLVIPILALLLYRKMGEALSIYIPNWMKCKRR